MTATSPTLCQGSRCWRNAFANTKYQTSVSCHLRLAEERVVFLSPPFRLGLLKGRVGHFRADAGARARRPASHVHRRRGGSVQGVQILRPMERRCSTGKCVLTKASHRFGGEDSQVQAMACSMFSIGGQVTKSGSDACESSRLHHQVNGLCSMCGVSISSTTPAIFGDETQ